MTNKNHISAIVELSESEGIFTTAQAARIGVSRDALHDAAASGRVERIAHGAYRLMGSGANDTDELVALWKLSSPALFAYERIVSWDGVCIGGTTAAFLNDMGEFNLSPYRMFSPQRINSRNSSCRIGTRTIDRCDVSFERGFPVTKPERTIFDLVLDHEDPSLIANALASAERQSTFDAARLQSLLESRYGNTKGAEIVYALTSTPAPPSQEE